MKKILAGLALCYATVIAGCTCDTAYLMADRARYEAIAPEYVAYVGSDTKLTKRQKDRRLFTIESWKAALEAAEAQD